MPLTSTLASISASGYRSNLAPGAVPTPTILTSWVAHIGRFSGNSSNAISDIVVTPNGDFYICGQSKVNYSTTSGSFAITKFSSTGQIIWQKIFETFLNTYVVAAVCVDPNNNLYFVGSAQYTANRPVGYTTNTGIDGYFGKLNSADGSTVFLKRINFNLASLLTREDNLQGIAYSPTDNTIVVTGTSGYMSSISLGYASKCLIAKYTLTGEIVWQRINYYTTDTNDNGIVLYGKDVSIDTSGNIYVTAANSYIGTTTTGNTLLSLSSNGTRRWAVRENFTGINSSNIIPRKIITTSNNNTVVAAFGNPTVTANSSTIIMATVTQYNSSGTKLWQIQPNLKIAGYTGTSPGVNGSFVGLTSDSSNNIYVAFVGISNFRLSSSYPYGNDCILLYKLNGSTGSIIWIRAIILSAALAAPGSGYNDNPITRPTGLKCLGNFLYLVGYTDATLTTVRDTLNGVFLKIPTDGSILSTTGIKFNSQMGYKIIDATTLHSLFTYTSTTQTVTSSISDNVYNYLNNLSVDANIASTDNNMVKQIALI